jgi:hypothetical protein
MNDAPVMVHYEVISDKYGALMKLQKVLLEQSCDVLLIN